MVYRPYVSVVDSAGILSENDLPLLGKFTIARIINSFIEALETDIIPDLILKNNNVKWYWNNGQPFFADLLEYHNTARKEWIKNGGEAVNILGKNRDKIKASGFADKEGKWTEGMSNVHKFLLMERNFFWYQRFWCNGDWNIRGRQMKNENPFNLDGSPRSIATSKIRSETNEIIRTDRKKDSRKKKQESEENSIN